MSTRIVTQLLRGTATEHNSYTGPLGSITADTTNLRPRLHDGSTAGGIPIARLDDVAAGATRRAIADAATAVAATDRMLVYTSLSAARVVTLCAASAFPTGTRLLIIDESGACTPTVSITISRAGSDTINGLTSVVIGSPYGSVCLESNGSSKWSIVDQTTEEPERVSLDRFVEPGTTNHTTAIQAWWDYILSKLVDSEVQSTPVIGIVPPKVYTASSGLSLDASKYGVHIEGYGWPSRLVNVEIVASKPFFKLRDLSLTGSTGVSNGVVFKSFSQFVLDCYIRDRSVGVLSESGALHHVHGGNIHRCGIGVHVSGGPGGQNFEHVEIGSCTTGGALLGSGGETKMLGCRIMGNAGYGLKMVDDGNALAGSDIIGPIESYFTDNTITNTTGSTESVTSIASHSGGSRIAVTLSAPHKLSSGLGSIRLTGTGVVAYDDVITYIYDVLSTTQVVLDIPYVSNATGSLNSPGFDLVFGATTLTGVRNMYFFGGNINSVLVDGAYNVQFHGTRLKQRVWLTGSENSQIFFSRVGPTGEYGSGDGDVPSSERVKPIPISGPGSVEGWAEIVSSQSGKSDYGAGGEFISIRAPRSGTPLNADQTPALFNEIRTGVDGTYINSYPYEIATDIADDAYLQITIPEGRKSAVVHVSVIGSGEPLLAYSGLLSLDCGSTLEFAKQWGGASLDGATGALTGTTGTDGRVTVSAQTGGLIYIENRSGASRLFRIRYVN